MNQRTRAARGWLRAAVALGAMLAAPAVGAQQVPELLMAVSGSPGTLRIQGAVAGEDPTPVADNSTTYTITVSVPNAKITAHLDAPMPSGVTLAVTLAAPPGATSLSQVPLDATPRDVVTGLGITTGSTHSITYHLSATVAAGVVPLQARSVTLTLAALP